MSTSDPHGTDKSAEEPIPQTSLDVLLWKLDLLETIINDLPNPVFAKNSDTRFCFFKALPGFPWVADLLMSFPEGTNEGYGPIFSDSRADRALVC